MSNKYRLQETSKFTLGLDKHQKSGQSKIVIKIFSLLEELENHPTMGTGRPEPLKGYGERFVYSRRIDKQHRLIYEIFEEEKKVKLLSAYGHYDDK